MLIRTLAGAALLATLSLPATAADVGVLTPRTPLRKTPTHRLDIPRSPDGEIVSTGRLIVKFHDSVKARSSRTPNVAVSSLSGENLNSFQEIVLRNGLKVRQALNRDTAALEKLQQSAAAESRRAQPDLAGMIYVEAPLEVLVVAAREINALPTVEFVEFEQEMIHHVPTPAPLPMPGEDLSCNNSTQDCFAEGMEPFCGDFACCTLIGNVDPFCVDPIAGMWDIFCVNLAQLYCEMGDKCMAPLVNGGCFEPHPSAGCNNETCCAAVGKEEPFCINVQWDDTCVILALTICGTGGGTDTPDFTMSSRDPATRYQKYTTFGPVEAGDGFEEFGLTGDGLDLAMLEALGQILIDDYGVGTENLARGKGIRVGVVEHSAYVTGPKVAEGGERWHEDLDHIIPEPDQTIITIEGGVLNPDHGTSTLGQINAADNGFGVTGIARDAQGYFFPIVSVQEGGRTLNAMIAATETFEKGDVLNYSIGPGGGGTLVSSQANWVLVRLGSDKGITSCISAGNDCFNLDDAPQFDDQDSGAIIVGACFPGRVNQDPPPQGLGRFCRLGFSNHCRQCPDASVVHCSAWGILVTTTGAGDLFGPTNAAGDGVNKARAYTKTFNGTSSAAPIICGLAACLQGLAKQFYGIALAPEQIRGLISGNGFPQCDFPNPAGLPGSSDQEVCGGDFNFQEAPRLINGFPRAFECGVGVITGNFFSASPILDAKVITGNLLSGNQNSLKAVDNNFYVVETVQKFGGDKGTGTPPPITYIAGGQTTDIEVNAFTGTLPADVTGVAVEVVAQADAPYVILGVYLRNWVDGRWTLMQGIDVSAGGGFNFNSVQAEKAPNYVSSDGLVLVRVWTCGLGAVPKHKVFYDFVNVFISDQPGFDPFGGDGGDGGGG